MCIRIKQIMEQYLVTEKFNDIVLRVRAWISSSIFENPKPVENESNTPKQNGNAIKRFLDIFGLALAVNLIDSGGGLDTPG